MLTIIVPMAGRGSRFASEGFKLPKPLIDVSGRPMIEWVIKNIKPQRHHQFIFIVQEEHCQNFHIDKVLLELEPTSKIVKIDKITEGALCTVLLSERLIPPNAPIMIANSDQFIDFDINSYLEFMDHKLLDGLIMTMEANDPKWSFVKLKEDRVVSVVEKQVISNEATVGIYNFANSSAFLQAAHAMIESNERVNGEFYVAPVYNHLIKNKANVGYFNIGKELDGMYGLGIPADLNKFLKLKVSELYFQRYFK